MALKFLILEDSEFDAELILRELKSLNFKFNYKQVSTKEDFQSEVRNWKPDLIISDYNLPAYQGNEALAFAKDHLKDTPIVILSGSFNQETQINLLKNRADGVLVKEDLKRLPFTVRRVLNEANDKKKLRDTLSLLSVNLKFQEVLAEISLNFNSTDDFEAKMNFTVSILGAAADVSRVYIFEDIEEGNACRNVFEWCAEGIEAQIHDLQNVPYSRMPSWKKIIKKEGRIFAGDVKKLPKDLADIMVPFGIKAVLCYPLYVGEEYFGFIGFDETKEVRDWNKSTDKLLKTVSGIISNAYSEELARRELQQTNEQLIALIREKELLIGEVHHRVKNNLALISSFLQLDQMGMGVKDQTQIVSSNILRIKSIAIIHELVYEQGSFSDIDIYSTLNRILVESHRQEGFLKFKVERMDNNKEIKFNINQAVPFSLLVSEIIFEAFRANGSFIYEPPSEFKIHLSQDNDHVRVVLMEESLARVLAAFKKKEEYKFTEILEVLTKQIDASLTVEDDLSSATLEFVYRDVKGSSSTMVGS